ncbi:hypothetical protein [Marinagarivorans cellulosilyticus]|uniref:hypothetical protein n=1 Tax=Marinagarivorans cellulosilyticus TaxID=2721545 RepID=UPI001F1FBA49|nr:hypothetical protein [Marinagarivorans cellulosilyticus]
MKTSAALLSAVTSRFLSLYTLLKRIDWDKYSMLSLRIIWGAIAVTFSAVIVVGKVLSLGAASENEESSDDESDEDGTLFVNMRTGEKSPMKFDSYDKL